MPLHPEISRIPSIEIIRKFIYDLSNVNLNSISIERIQHRIGSDLSAVPCFRATLKKGSMVQRGRILNDLNNPFTSEKDISYPDSQMIKNFGRANLPNSNFFYGTVKQGSISTESALTILHEIEPNYREFGTNREIEIPKNVYLTLGQWEVTDDLVFADIIHNELARKNSARIREAFDFHESITREEFGDRYNDIVELQTFLSDEFARNNTTNEDYKITAAYSEFLMFHRRELAGITYPSVKMELKTQNVAIRPYYVEHCLKLNAVVLYQFTPDSNNVVRAIPIKAVKSFGKLNSTFEWKDTIQNEFGEYVIEK